MTDGSASLMATHFANDGLRSEPGKGVLGGGAPYYRCYETSDGKYMAVGSIEPKFYAALCEGTGLTYQDEQLNDALWPERIAGFTKRFKDKTRAEWTEIFERLDACVSPVLDLKEAQTHPHNQARALFPEGPDRKPHVAPTPKLSRTPGSLRSAEPIMGQHTDDVLLAAGFSTEDIDQLVASGAVVRGTTK